MATNAAELDRAGVIEALSQISSTPNPDDLDGDANLLKLGHVDSLQFLNLVTLLEQRTGTQIDFLAIDPAGMTSINGLIRTFNT